MSSWTRCAQFHRHVSYLHEQRTANNEPVEPKKSRGEQRLRHEDGTVRYKEPNDGMECKRTQTMDTHPFSVVEIMATCDETPGKAPWTIMVPSSKIYTPSVPAVPSNSSRWTPHRALRIVPRRVLVPRTRFSEA